MTFHYVDMGAIASWFDVSRRAVANWHARYAILTRSPGRTPAPITAQERQITSYGLVASRGGGGPAMPSCRAWRPPVNVSSASTADWPPSHSTAR
jgi:hypothetical protein